MVKYGKVYSNGGHGKVAYATGTAYNMLNAYAGSSGGIKASRTVNTPISSNKSSSSAATNANTKATKANTKATNNASGSLDKFKKWVETLFDWIEVRLELLRNSIDLNTQKSENAVGYQAKNSFVQSAMNLVGTGKETYSLKTSKGIDGYQRITGITSKNVKAGTLIGDNLRGAARYLKEAETVINKAASTGILTKARAQEIAGYIQSGAINISEYNEQTREFISQYKTW